MDYFYKMYFKSKSLDLKKYYFDLYLKSYFKKIKEDTSDFLTEHFIEKENEIDIEIERIIYNFETRNFNFINKVK